MKYKEVSGQPNPLLTELFKKWSVEDDISLLSSVTHVIFVFGAIVDQGGYPRVKKIFLMTLGVILCEKSIARNPERENLCLTLKN
jgi:hypothetical protein